MPVTLTSLPHLATFDFDDIIDVRSPAEFAEDHLPGAISLPVLSDAERAEVGTVYKQVSPFTARKLGAALVAQNAARHLQGPLAGKDGAWRPLVYCWRGGQRSGSLASILSQVGWRTETLAGGYKSWRSLIVRALYDDPVASPVIVLDGNTGTAKTALLNRLPALGIQVLDLEGMANHRGSLFGAMSGSQPSQKAFEAALGMGLAALDPARPVVVEAESSKIGDCRLPPRLWQAMTTAPRIAIEAPPEARAAYLAHAYTDLTADPLRLAATVSDLRRMHGADVISEWQALAATGNFTALALALITTHYDTRYARHRARSASPAAIIASTSLDPVALDALASRIAAAIEAVAKSPLPKPYQSPIFRP